MALTNQSWTISSSQKGFGKQYIYNMSVLSIDPFFSAAHLLDVWVGVQGFCSQNHVTYCFREHGKFYKSHIICRIVAPQQANN